MQSKAESKTSGHQIIRDIFLQPFFFSPPPLIPIPKDWKVGTYIDLDEDEDEEDNVNKIPEWTRMNMLGEAKNILSSGLRFLDPQSTESNVPYLKTSQIQQSISAMTFTTEEKSLCSNIEKNFLLPSSSIQIPDCSSTPEQLTSLSPKIFGIFGNDVDRKLISVPNSVDPMGR